MPLRYRRRYLKAQVIAETISLLGYREVVEGTTASVEGRTMSNLPPGMLASVESQSGKSLVKSSLAVSNADK